MQRITEDLVRKKSEHNEKDILSLEELSLHQEDIGKLENLQKWCKDLKILLLHNNLISKIENIGRLKSLEYINFSLNNIEKIENLEGCESLTKLDFTLNFIGELTSVESLRKNEFLEILYLTGNPCTDYDGYREYVIATLPQLKTLDGTDILISERIEAVQNYNEIKESIIQQQSHCKLQREKQKNKNQPKLQQYIDENGELIENYEVENGFWQQTSDNSPETRIDIALKSRKCREKGKPKEVKRQKRDVIYFKSDGTPYNMNLGKFPFLLDDDWRNNRYVLDVTVQKYLDTNFIEVDVQPNYVRVTIKKKILQLRLDQEVCPSESKSTRSISTGHLIVEMPKLKPYIGPSPAVDTVKTFAINKRQEKKREFLDVHEKEEFNLQNFLTIRPNDKNDSFVDDPDVPPLE
ncbi:protein tilB homolog [Cimex lectularius]|uniref:U2A'/phosphoprotein 32 family A C-terminal domain-containing protein n=1 Tax=Cimex lectularius TaxID=79782 RepID=A0A8I6RQK6_CIMLE|nr:protein tilB homolog [Cimex lectularius]